MKTKQKTNDDDDKATTLAIYGIPTVIFERKTGDKSK